MTSSASRSFYVRGRGVETAPLFPPWQHFDHLCSDVKRTFTRCLSAHKMLRMFGEAPVTESTYKHSSHKRTDIHTLHNTFHVFHISTICMYIYTFYRLVWYVLCLFGPRYVTSYSISLSSEQPNTILERSSSSTIGCAPRKRASCVKSEMAFLSIFQSCGHWRIALGDLGVVFGTKSQSKSASQINRLLWSLN